MTNPLRCIGFAFALCVSAAAGAQAGPALRIDIPAGELVPALRALAKQSGTQFIYRAEQLNGLKTAGVHGTLSGEQALSDLLEGTGFTAHRDASGALAIVKQAAAQPNAEPAPAPPPSTPPAATDSAAQAMQPVVVTGSRIPRVQVEGPAPVVTITQEDIRNDGFVSTAAVMSSLTQNLGALDNNQNTNGFSPGAQAVDLRGLGPNHTLVLVNGRRIADYPQSYGGNSNFTDISNIPMSMIDRIEVLSGSASAVYGSDAVSGVINFILLKKANGTTIDLQVGDTEHGGGASQRLQISSGFSRGDFDSVFGLELYNLQPLWAYQRSFTDSRQDSPVDPSRNYPSQNWVRSDIDDDYIDPGQATCDALAGYDMGSILYAHRRNYGNYCGSYKDVGYGTLENGRQSANFYGTATYHLSESINFFLDLQAATSHQDSYNTPLQWQNSYQLNGDSAPVPFFNAATGQVEQWQRRYFTIEENGGFKPGEIRNINNLLTFNLGMKGILGGDSDWNYEATFGHSQNQLEAKTPALVSARAQALYLGPSLGVDPDSGYNIYDAPVSRFYTPLTVAQFRSITQDSSDNDFSRAETYSFQVTNVSLFTLPAGPVGFAGIAEYGNQYFGLKADPLSLDGTYYGLHNTSAVGSRDHAGTGVEFNLPLFSQLTATAAGRYDRYGYSGTSSDKFTYSLGLEYRPLDNLLLRGSYGTGFRAPDLSYLYAGLSGSSSGGSDYYLCRLNEPDVDISDCSNGDISYNGRSHGSTDLQNETSKSATYGFVYSPIGGFDFSVDYYMIKLSNEVQYQSSDMVLREEADCRLGQTVGGQPVDINSALCQQVLSQVVRNPASDPANPNGVTSVLVLPINAAVDRTSGVDFNGHYRLPTDRFGTFDFNLGYTYVISHTIQLFADQPVDNQLTDWYYYVIPRSKAKYSVTWSNDKIVTTLYGSRIGGLPNYDGDQRLGPTFLYNASFSYSFNQQMVLNLTIDNLFDTKPGKDQTWTSYPYYASRWFSPIGRAYFAEFNYRFGVH